MLKTINANNIVIDKNFNHFIAKDEWENFGVRAIDLREVYWEKDGEIIVFSVSQNAIKNGKKFFCVENTKNGINISAENWQYCPISYDEIWDIVRDYDLYDSMKEEEQYIESRNN